MRIVRFVGNKRCEDQIYRKTIIDEDAFVFDGFTADRNATMKFSMANSPVRVPIGGSIRDFLELALNVYIADTLVVRDEAADRWSRSFEFVYPVTDPTLWTASAAQLTDMLDFLSGDLYTFRFPHTRSLPPLPKSRQCLPSGVDAVCLFSGGFDSLFGAYCLLSQRKNVLLVGHQAEGVTSKAQKRLADDLCRLFPDSFSFVQMRGSVSGTKKPKFGPYKVVERTYRTRSFLFLALGVAIAAATRAPALYIPENGLIALNPPLGASRLGSLSTRTAHPRFLNAFKNVVSELGLFEGELRNPFMFESKTDLAQRLPSELKAFVRDSVSCSNVNLGLLGAKGAQRHCGHCVPCLYRRFALSAADLDAPADYVSDAFVDLEHMSKYTQSNFKLLVAFARNVNRMNNIQLQTLVTSHGWFPPEVGQSIGPHAASNYQPWAEMLARWANHTLRQTSELCSQRTKKLLGSY